MDRTLIVPAAGRGSRFGGAIPKPLVEIFGVPLVTWVVESVQAALPGIRVVIVVTSDNRDSFEEALSPTGLNVEFVVDDSYRGSAAATYAALPHVTTNEVIVAWADHIGVRFIPADMFSSALLPSTIGAMPVVRRSRPYVVLEINHERILSGFLDPSDVARQDLGEGLSDCGVFILARRPLESLLSAELDSRTGEVNLLQVLARRNQTFPVVTYEISNPWASLGINTHEDLEAAMRVVGPSAPSP